MASVRKYLKIFFLALFAMAFVVSYFSPYTNENDELIKCEAYNEFLLDIVVLEEPADAPSQTPVPTSAYTPEPTLEPTPTPQPYTDIIIGAAGDIMAHIRQIEDANDAGGKEGYAFYHWFEFIKPALSYPDLMIANLEGPIAGEERGYNGYPMFNFPDEIVPAMMDAGIDVALNANNHVMDRMIEGLHRTIDVLDDAGMYHTGAWKSREDKNEPLVIDVCGIKVGVISATYSLNGLERRLEPEVLGYTVCYIDPEQVKERIELCREYGAEAIVVCPHMGDELYTHSRREFIEYAHSYIEMGADIVFACHPHVVQPIENYETVLEDGTRRKGVIFYSLGNLVSGMYGVEKETGAIGYVTLRRDNHSGEVSLQEAKYLPISTLRHSQSGYLYHIVPVGQCLDFPSMIDKLLPSKGNFNRMQRSWDIAVEVMGTQEAELLRYMPIR